MLDLVIHDCMRADFIINNDKQAVILIQRFLNEAGERCEQGCSWSSVGDTIIRRIYSIDKDSNTERYREKQRSSFFSADLRLEGLSSVYRQNKTVFLLKYQIKDSFFEKIIPSYCALIKSY